MQKKTGAADLDLPLVNEPGAQWTYGASTRVLGQVIEKISGQTIDATSKPESSARSGCETRPTPCLPPRLTRVVTRRQKADGKITEIPNPDPIPPTIRGDGGLYSTAPDYARFIQMLLNKAASEA